MVYSTHHATLQVPILPPNLVHQCCLCQKFIQFTVTEQWVPSLLYSMDDIGMCHFWSIHISPVQYLSPPPREDGYTTFNLMSLGTSPTNSQVLGYKATSTGYFQCMGKDQVSHLLIANLEDVISPMPSLLYVTPRLALLCNVRSGSGSDSS